jgi:hypothetical protein
MGVWGAIGTVLSLGGGPKRTGHTIRRREVGGNYALVLGRGPKSLHSVMFESPEVQPGPITFALNEPVIQLLCPGPKAPVANLALRSAVCEPTPFPWAAACAGCPLRNRLGCAYQSVLVAYPSPEGRTGRHDNPQAPLCLRRSV